MGRMLVRPRRAGVTAGAVGDTEEFGIGTFVNGDTVTAAAAAPLDLRCASTGEAPPAAGALVGVGVAGLGDAFDAPLTRAGTRGLSSLSSPLSVSAGAMTFRWRRGGLALRALSPPDAGAGTGAFAGGGARFAKAGGAVLSSSLDSVGAGRGTPPRRRVAGAVGRASGGGIVSSSCWEAFLGGARDAFTGGDAGVDDGFDAAGAGGWGTGAGARRPG